MDNPSLTSNDPISIPLAENANVSNKPKRKRKTLGTYCAAIDCHNSRRNCNLSMFRFPKSEERCRKWVQNTRRDDIRYLLSKSCTPMNCALTTLKIPNLQIRRKRTDSSKLQFQHCLLYQIHQQKLLLCDLQEIAQLHSQYQI